MRRQRFIPNPQPQHPPGQLPPALRCFAPKLGAKTVKGLAMVHIQNLDAIATGQADEQILWDWVAGLLTWSRVADQLQRGVEPMREQLELATRVIDRYGRTGRVLFDGLDYQLAKTGTLLMDGLAEVVDLDTANAAAEWSELRVNEMAQACAARTAA